MNLLLDTDVVAELCSVRSDRKSPSARALDRCRSLGGRIWLYAGSAQAYEAALVRRSTADTPADDTPIFKSAATARKTLFDFARDKQWLAALPGDLADPASHSDLAQSQHLGALDRFELGTARLLTLDRELAAAHPDKVVDPEGFLEMPLGAAALDFVDLKAQQDRIRPALEGAIHRVLHHGRFVMGPEVAELERRLAAYTGAAHCIAVSSGTDALLIALMALGIGPGDEVVTTPFTFVATAEVIVLAGAVPVFVDIEPDTYNLDARLIEAAITPRTKAIMPVSLYGQAADMDAIGAVAARHRLPVVEDAAQSFGATYKGRRSCNLSTVGCTSFFPSKPLGCYGDGGAIFTSDDALATAMREIRVHGQGQRYVHSRVGVCGRLDSLQAAVLLAKLDGFEDEIARRQAAGRSYTERLAGVPGVVLPVIRSERSCVYAQYTVQIPNRDAVAQALHARGIPTAVHYPIPLDAQPAYRHLGTRNGTPVAAQVSGRVLSLPMHADLSQDALERVVDALAEVSAGSAA